MAFVGDSSLPLYPIGVDTAPALGGFDSSTRCLILALMAGKSLRGHMLDELQVATDILLDGEAEGSVVLWALEVISLPCPLVKKGRDRKCFRSSFGFYHLSKFLPSEWFPYVEFFEGASGIKACPKGQVPLDISYDFDVAWLKHQHRNRHHWQYWRLREDDGGTKLIPMPPVYVKEMLADWRGASRAQGFEEIGPWYAKKRDGIELHEESRDLLHSLMTAGELELCNDDA